MKRFIYGILYLTILALVIYGVYGFFARITASCFDEKQNQNEVGIDCGGNCQACEFQTIVPIQVRGTTVFHVNEDFLSVYFELKNPNVRHGTDQLTYELRLLNNSGTTVGSLIRNSYIYPGEIKTIVEPGLRDLNLDVTHAEVEILQVTWLTRDQFSSPRISTRDIQVTFNAETKRAVITGIVVNKDAALLGETTISALISNRFGTVVSVSKTVLDTVGAFRERSFQISIPDVPLESVARNAVEIFVAARR